MGLLAYYDAIDLIRDLACLGVGFASGIVWCSLRAARRRRR